MGSDSVLETESDPIFCSTSASPAAKLLPMPDQLEKAADIRCPRCGETSSGHFCASCGAVLHDVKCANCDRPLAAGDRFCGNCGTPVAAGTEAGAARELSGGAMTKFVVATALLMLVAYVAGRSIAGRGDGDAGTTQAGGTTPAMRAPDISSMSPEERATRLFDRVMAYIEQGKLDSARFFAPMAIQAYQMIGPLDLHARYDIGTISAAVGETKLARLEADSILAAQPTNLLGLTLAIRAATMAGNADAAAKFRQRLVAAAPAERAKNLKEYAEHSSDIDRALGKP